MAAIWEMLDLAVALEASGMEGIYFGVASHCCRNI